MEVPADFHEEGRRWARVETPAAFLASVLARLRSEIEEIPGIGPARQTELLRHFGSHKQVPRAGMEEHLEVLGPGPQLARRVYESLHPEKNSDKNNG